MQLIQISALSDNYIWLLVDSNNHCIIVDPSLSEPIVKKINTLNLTPIAILLTHHHSDHVDGVPELLTLYPNLTVFGPAETKIKGAQYIVDEGDAVKMETFDLQVFALPGHTIGHIGYYQAPYLFCGDTLFSAGCGRIFEGTPEQMYHSIEKIALLPDETLICCGHEYTESNLRFAHHVWPENESITNYLQIVHAKRQKQQPTVPSTLKKEKEINLFLQCNDINLQNKLPSEIDNQPVSMIFAKLRQLKDQF